MSNRRRTRGGGGGGGGGDNEAPSVANNNAAQSIRERSRAVAEREASRLARPDQPAESSSLGHASRKISGVSSTPFGMMMGRNPMGSNKNDGVQEEW